MCWDTVTPGFMCYNGCNLMTNMTTLVHYSSLECYISQHQQCPRALWHMVGVLADIYPEHCGQYFSMKIKYL